MSPVYRSPMDDNGYDISDYQDIDPLFGTLADLDELVAGAARPRHEAGHGPGGEPHLRRAPLVRRIPVQPRQPQAGLVLVARRPPGPHAGHAGRGADQLGVALLRPDLDLGRAHRPVLPAHLLPQAARPELGEPRGPPGRLRDDAVVAGPRRGRVPDGRHQHDQQGHCPCRTPSRGPGPYTALATSTSPSARATTSSWPRCTARSSPAGTCTCLPSARCPASPCPRRCCSPTRTGTSSTWCSSSSTSGWTSARNKYDLRPAAAARPQSLDGDLADRFGRTRLELALLRQP